LRNKNNEVLVDVDGERLNMPRNNFSVDDILQEIRAKRNAVSESQVVDENPNDVTPEICSNTATEFSAVDKNEEIMDFKATSRCELRFKRETLTNEFIENNDIQIDGFEEAEVEEPDLEKLLEDDNFLPLSPEPDSEIVEKTTKLKTSIEVDRSTKEKDFWGAQLIVSASSFLVLMWLFLLNVKPTFLPSFLKVVLDQPVSVLINLLFLIIPIATNIELMLFGLKCFVKFKADASSLVCISVLGALGQNIVGLLNSYVTVHNFANIYSVVAIGAWFFYSLSRYMLGCVEERNQQLLAKGNVYMFKKLKIESAEQLRYLVGNDDGNVSILEEGNGWESASEKLPDYFDNVCRIFTPILFLIAGVSAVFFAFKEDYQLGITIFSGLLTMGAPFAGSFCCGLVFLNFAKQLCRGGGGISSLSALNLATSVDAAIVDGCDLISNTHTKLLKMELFEKKLVDFAILSAASILSAALVEAVDVFTCMLASKDMLKPVEGLNFEGDMGFSGWIDGKRILFGSRELMINHGVRTPSREFEKIRLIAKPGEIISRAQYVAVDGVLLAMFIVGYKPLVKVRRMLAHLQKNKVGIFVNVKDVTFSHEFFSTLYGLEKNSMAVVPLALSKNLEISEESQVFVKEKLFGLNLILTEAKRAQNTAKVTVFVQMLGAVIGLGLVNYFVLCGNLSMISATNVLGYHMLWLLLCFVIVLFRSI
jgi:cation transport ATPase